MEGVAVMEIEEFQSYSPAPEVLPPVPALIARSYLLILKIAVMFRSCVMSTVVVEAFMSAMPSPLHPEKE